ncbi:Tim44 domain-containing protein [Hwanghaeella grinnelliae]|uniref:Tim44 domain-containing protein n=1 Tax=Hwanghaeella grinnelliae TaxID=2500179 RepID=A0A437QP68_9PROT|nr:Tim44/TimA family putative adaptor protein [Hwanghaeella grinnelliae]RVU36229.1 Tim44 domain-containing protein [Hwanghaeella grinnelliae]
MGSEFNLIDILIFAGIALFLIIRLGSVLGRRTGHQEPPTNVFGAGKKDEDAKNDNGNVVQLPQDRKPGEEDDAFAEAEGPLDAGLTQIKVADPDFNPNEFVSGSKMAFEMVLVAYTEGDEATLRNLLSPEVFDNFRQALKARSDAGQRLEEALIGIDGADILEAKMEGSNALVTVKFVSQQAHALYDSEGKVIEGDPNKIVSVTDIWTFKRDTRSHDPNWALVATRSSN